MLISSVEPLEMDVSVSILQAAMREALSLLVQRALARSTASWLSILSHRPSEASIKNSHCWSTRMVLVSGSATIHCFRCASPMPLETAKEPCTLHVPRQFTTNPPWNREEQHLSNIAGYIVIFLFPRSDVNEFLHFQIAISSKCSFINSSSSAFDALFKFCRKG